MVISHKYRYVFVELPHTGCTAIRTELLQHYAGQVRLHKHALYDEFLQVATPEEKKYFVFSGIRNPLDEVVSIYFKFKTDHKWRYSNLYGDSARPPNRTGRITRADRERFRLAHDVKADFPTYFRKFYQLPYNNMSSLAHKRFDFIIRFERIQEDFAEALKRLGIEARGPLPLVNRTSEKNSDFYSYYTPAIIPQAKRVFGPFMREWHYSFPPAWGNSSISPLTWLTYHSLNLVRNFYWRHLRWHPTYGRLLQNVR
jgi:hypothetical protein